MIAYNANASEQQTAPKIVKICLQYPRYQALVGGCEPLQSFLHKRLAENLNSEAALGTVGDVAQCVQWLRSTFLYVRAARDPRKYLGLPQNSPQHLISKKIEELCVKAMNGLASSGLITMDEVSCIESTEAGRLMSIFYLDLETMKQIMKIEGTETLDRLLALICESHELADMHLRVDERRCLNTLNRNSTSVTIRFPMKGKISTRQMKLNCMIQAVLGCLPIPDPSLNQEAMKIMRIADRVCKCLVTYVTRQDLISRQPQFYLAVLNSIILAKCVSAHLWENSPFVSKQLRGIGPTFSTLLASAGKVNFMLLEESHPRDLERIMNKGAPAGNVLRKQISLLPKYQLTMKLVDEMTVTVQLVLLNKSFLAENMDNLTAGDSHKGYIIVGDSNNHLLLLATFMDKHLINVFDGTITYEIKRKHNFEHKISAHCISTSFVGIDVQTEYFFSDLNRFFDDPSTNNDKNYAPAKKLIERQTCITETFKERKRKNTDRIDHSKEKKKRDNAIIENFKLLKQSFEAASKNLKEQQESNVFEQVLYTNTDKFDVAGKIANDTSCVIDTKSEIDHCNIYPDQNTCNEDVESDEFVDDEKIANLLNEIENEMAKSKPLVSTQELSNNNIRCSRQKNSSDRCSLSEQRKVKTNCPKKNVVQNLTTDSRKTIMETRKRKSVTGNSKSNYNFIELLEKNLSLEDDDDKIDTVSKNDGFLEAIKSQVQKYLMTTQKEAIASDKDIEILLENPESNSSNNYINKLNHEANAPVNLMLNSYPRYEITEILDCKDSINITQSGAKIFDCNEDSKIYKTNDKNEINGNEIDTISNNYIIAKTVKNTDHTNIKSSQNNEYLITLDDEDFTNTIHKYNLSNRSNEIMYADQVKANKAISKDETPDEINKLPNENYRQSNINNFKLKIHSEVVCDESNVSKNLISNKSYKDSHDHTQGLTNNNQTDTNNLSEISITTKNSDATEIFKGHETSKTKILEEVPRSEVVPKDSYYAFVKDNLELHNHAQTPCKSLCKTSDTNYMRHFPNEINDSQKLLNNASEKIGNQQAVYFKKYSASKTDICASENSKYCMKVIKTVKLDLDVTAIVYRKHHSFRKHTSENAHTFKNREETDYTNLSRPYKELKKNSKDVDELLFVNNNDPRNTLATNLFIPSKNKMPKLIVQQENKHVNFQSNEMNVVKNLNIDYKEIAEDLSSVESDDSSINEDNKIKNILQKYSSILGKQPAKCTATNSASLNKTPPSMSSSTAKSKKPFKINDIHKLHATLPKTKIHIPEADKNSRFSEIIDNIEPENKFGDLISNQYAQCAINKSVKETLPKHESLLDMDFEPLHLPSNIDSEPSNDFTIDQSMFDPKTLLQCVVDDDCTEIVPPPPEFCDDPSYSPDYENDKVLTPDDHSQCFKPHLTENVEYNKSIFDDLSATLTPSKEIETWNLSLEDRCRPSNNNSLNLSPVKSFTMMRKNCITNEHDSLHNSNILSRVSRKYRLSEFRFRQKNKLKIKN